MQEQICYKLNTIKPPNKSKGNILPVSCAEVYLFSVKESIVNAWILTLGFMSLIVFVNFYNLHNNFYCVYMGFILYVDDI